MPTDLTRRSTLGLLSAAAFAAVLPGRALALNTAEARELIERAIGEVNAVISSGKSETQMYAEFERIFERYADTRFIALSALGPAGRTASKADLEAYIKAFKGYIARKYGKRFREFIGGRIEVVDAHPLKSFYEVRSVAHLRGEAPFQVDWHVFEKNGKRLFFNIIIEGVNMLAAERTEIGAMLDRRRGDVGALARDLLRAG
ncbi:phospholipid transport system substrate-binding protein [Albidovulum inexpectatum]|uniref:Phospholipid transport system substrate-binding protein n=1 Tax=Albidovulum inexpectatum TaxID=196587 RepID=A0A2S5JLS6_9RHOB|nr:ABC transporter substrate-binding protein [Albidovulum inexpectatum]PPB82382.1 phospholipid transport system substrate-binding protein [Albidovulum inexpectatum]